MSFSNVYKGKKVLITGHTGFKGSWMAIWLRLLGAEVFGYSLKPYTEKDNFVTTGLENRINHRIGDVRNAHEFINYFKDVQPDFAFHLAAQPLVLLSYKEPIATFETNLMGVVHFFEAVRQTPSVKVAINITSDKCYDNKEWVWGYRETDAMGGKDPYSASKGCAELITNSYLNSYFKESSCRIASARAGNVIGGGDWAQDRIIPDFIRSIIEKNTLKVRNPHSTRPWQHVLEPLSGYLALGAAMELHGAEFCGGWNFGPQDSANYSVKELIEGLIAVGQMGQFEIIDNEEKKSEANILKLDISKAVNQLKWKPALEFNETIEYTLKGYLDDLRGGDLYKARETQILSFTEQAKIKKIEWAL